METKFNKNSFGELTIAMNLESSNEIKLSENVDSSNEFVRLILAPYFRDIYKVI